jgi:hypothetical protein
MARRLACLALCLVGPPVAQAALERFFEAIPGSRTLALSRPVLAASSATGNKLVQVFLDSRSSNDVLRATSLDGGLTWQADGAALGQADALVPLSLSCARGTGLCVAAWRDKATSTVKTVLSLDSGVTWADAPKLDTAVGGISGGIADIALSCVAKADGKGLCVLAVAGTGAGEARVVAVYRGDNPAGGRAKWAFGANVGDKTGTSPLALSCADEASCVLVHGVSGVGGGGGLRSLFSAEQGRTWGTASVVQASARATAAAATPSAVALQCPTSARCVALVAWTAPNASLVDFSASSGGPAFARLAALSGDTLAGSEPSVFCADALRCMATYTAGIRTTLQVTGNGGATFSSPRYGPVPDRGATRFPSVACDRSAGLCTVSTACAGTAVQALTDVNSICVATSLTMLVITDPPVVAPTATPQTPSPSARPSSAQPSSAQPSSAQPSSAQPPEPPAAAPSDLPALIFPDGKSASSSGASAVVYLAAGIVLLICVVGGGVAITMRNSRKAAETQVVVKDDGVDDGRVSLDVSDATRTTRVIPEDHSVNVSFRFTVGRVSQFILHKVSSRWDSKIW